MLGNFFRPLLGWGFSLTAAVISAAGAILLTSDHAPEWMVAALVVISVLAVIYERSALTWCRNAFQRKEYVAVGLNITFLVFSVIYTAVMQIAFFGLMLLVPVAKDRASGGELTAVEQRIASLKARAGWQRSVPGTAESLRKQEKALAKTIEKPLPKNASPDARAERIVAERELRELRANVATAEGLEAIEHDIGEAQKRQVELLAKPPADAKTAIFVSLTGRDGHWLTYALILLTVVLIGFGQIVLPLISVGPQRPAPETKPEAPPVSDKGGNTGNTGGSETGSTPSAGDKLPPFKPRIVSGKPNGLDHDASATVLSPPVRETVIEHVSQEPVATPLKPVVVVSQPSARQLLIGSGRASSSRETVFPKVPARDKAKQRWETFGERYKDLDELIAETDRMPPIRELAKRWQCRPETVILIRNKWSAENEGPDGKHPFNKPPVRREKGRKLNRDLYDMAGSYQPQTAALQ